MSFEFFSRSRRFWAYHGLLTVPVFTLLTGLGAAFRNPALIEPNLSAGLVLVVLFTLTVLVFRYWYNKKRWYAFTAGKHLIVCLGMALSGALAITGLLFAILALLFWDVLMDPKLLQEQGVIAGESVALSFLGNTPILVFLLSGWMFIYTTTKSSRRAHDQELENLRLQNTLKEAQLTNLANQLNPHFLFNALNNIRFTIHENPAYADKMVTTLAELPRYSLTTNQRDKVCIKQELAMVEHQLAIGALQLEYLFFRASRQFIVNFHHITHIQPSVSEGYDLVMGDGPYH